MLIFAETSLTNGTLSRLPELGGTLRGFGLSQEKNSR